MKNPARTHLSHVGIHVYDIEKMVDYYTEILGLELTDRGTLDMPGKPQIAFLSSDPEEHHQIALAEGRSEGETPAVVLNQVSFHVDDLAAVRRMRTAVEEHSGRSVMSMSHGNAWSIYFGDPEGNTIEVFTRSPFHVRQPVAGALDLDQTDEEILAVTEDTYSGADDFGPAISWKDAFTARLEARWK